MTALSSLGKKSYLAYWSAAIARSILRTNVKRTSVQQIVQDTWIMPEDAICALKEMDIIEPLQKTAKNATILRERVEAWVKQNNVPTEPLVAGDGFLQVQEESDG